MRKGLLMVLIIQLSSLSLFAGGLLTEVCRIPLLIEHFEDHEKTNQEISFFSFLKEHYSQTDNTDSEHRELPFKSHIHVSSLILVLDQKNKPEETFVSQVFQAYVFPSSIGNVVSTAVAVFQPPQ